MVPEHLYHYTKGNAAPSIISGGCDTDKEICFWLKNASQKNDFHELLLGERLVNGLKCYMRDHGRSSVINEVDINPNLVYINSFTENDIPTDHMLKEYGRFRLEFNLRGFRSDGDIGECTYFGENDIDSMIDYYRDSFDKYWLEISRDNDTIALGNYILGELSAFVSIPFLKFRDKWVNELEWRHVFHQQDGDGRVFIHKDGFPRMRVFYPAAALVGITCYWDEKDFEDELSFYQLIFDRIHNQGWNTSVRLVHLSKNANVL